jgi:hypothetical protein
MDSAVPVVAIGARTACTRMPESRRTSTHGA